jgi:hypothetical protein
MPPLSFRTRVELRDYFVTTDVGKNPCQECRKFIEGLPADKPHRALHTDKPKFLGYREHSANYECRICHTKFHRDEKLPHGPPTWTVIE